MKHRLQIAQEEVQAVNKELTTLNDELKRQNAHLDALSNDLNNVLASIDIPVVILEKDRRIRRFTPEAEKVLNLVPGDVGRRINGIRFSVDIPQLIEMIDEAVKNARVIKREVRDRDGKWYLLSVRPYKSGDQTINGSLLVLFDIDEFKKAVAAAKDSQDALVRSRGELRSLTSRLTSVQETNNRILARELHDDITQRLAALAFNVATIAGHLPSSSGTLRKNMHALRDEIGKTAGDIQQLSHQLHPSILDDLGLVAALKAECSVFSNRHQTPCDFAAEHVPDFIPEDAALCLYRVAQEALRNVGKHANAEKVIVRLLGADGTIELSIIDIGDGFDLAKVRESRGLGLVSMEERTRMVDGQFSITSQEGKGTSVVVRVPLPRGKNEKANSAAG